MKKYYNILMVLAIVLTGLSLTACSEDDLDTNQYKQGVSLNVYGPQPVMRGGQLRFLGSNLDQIAQVIIPGCDPITSIETVKAGIPSEIRVTLPKDGPEVGPVRLITKTDEEIVTKTELTYIEGIEFQSFSPASIMPGETLTINGEYLNLVHMIEFADGVYVSEADFTSHDRYKIEVVVPENARTGKVGLYDVDLTALENPGTDVSYNIIETDEVLNIGTPTVGKLASPRGEAAPMGTVTAKTGELITVTGSHFNLIESLKFGSEDNVFTSSEFNVSEDGKTLTFTLPEEAPDGDLNLVCRSGVEVPAGIIETVAPSNCVAAPAPVKAGTPLTVTGNDMDVVNSVEMPNVEGVIEFTKAEDGKSIVVTSVPETAQEGNLVLRMKNGKGVEVPFTLVKPTVTGYDNATVSAGGALTIQGTDLDLVKTVMFGEGSDIVNVTPAEDGKSITLTVPMNAVSGEPTLSLANGTTVKGTSLSIEEAVFCYATELPGEDAEIKAGGTMTFTVANSDKLTGVEINGKACQYVLTNNSQLIIGIPGNAGAGTKVRLISSNGEITYTIDVTPDTEVNTVIWTGAVDLNNYSINWQFGDNNTSSGEDALAFTKIDLAEGDVIHFHVTAYEEEWEMQFFNGHWGGQTYIGDLFGNSGSNQVNSKVATLNNGCLDIPVTAQLVEELTTMTDWGYCWIFQGKGLVVTKISVTHYNSLEQDLSGCIYREDDSNVQMPLPVKMTWDSSGRFRVMTDREPCLKDMNLVAGKSVMKFYVSGTGQLQLNDPNWTALTTVAEWEDPSEKVMEQVLTQDLIDCLKGVKSDGWSSTGLIIQGDGFTVSKITILP